MTIELDHRNLDNINFRTITNKYKQCKLFHTQGFDTETDKGYCRVIANQNDYAIIKSREDLVLFLLNRKNRPTLNTFFNLKFDAEVILKWFPEILHSIKDNGNFGEGYGLRVKLIPGKLFSIRDGSKNGVRFFDIAQFFNTSLETASLQYLGMKCDELKHERADLFKKYPIERIGWYCRDDAEKTKKLTDFLLDKLGQLNVYTKNIYSAGHISQRYTVNNADIPTFTQIPPIIQKMYYAAFRGGWFDTYKKGLIKCSSYDLKSAYPWALSTIPNPTQGKWIKGVVEGSNTGIMKVLIKSQNWDCVTPILCHKNGYDIYPLINEEIITYITLNEYLNYKDFFDIEILEAYTFVPFDNCNYPYEPLTKQLFDLKEKYKDDKGLYETIKKIINSLYGKTAQRIREDGNIGRLFNPYFACECTSRCRVKLFNSIIDKWDKVVSVMTDGILLESGTHLNTGKNMGDWDIKFSNTNTLIVQTGIYQPEGGEIRTRGFTNKKPFQTKEGIEIKPVSLFELLNRTGNKIKVFQYRPLHFRECIIQNKFEKIGCFEIIEKIIDLNWDAKRLWLEDIKNAKQLLENNYTSEPLPSSLMSVRH